MTYLLRTLRLIALAAWVGGIFFFAFAVARIAFSVLHDPHDAGAIVRGTLTALHHIGFTAGLVYLAATLTLIALQGDSHLARAIEILIVTTMLALTGYSHFSVIPRMEADRLTLGGDVSKTPPTLPAHAHFDRLHRVSTRVEGFVLLGGVLLLCLAPLHQRDNRME